MVMIAAISYLYYSDYYTFQHKIDWIWALRIFEFKNHLNGSLFYIVFLYSAVVFGWVGVLSTWAISIVTILPCIISFTRGIYFTLQNVIILSVPMLVIVLGSLIIIWLRREKRYYNEREIERRAYMAHVLRVQEDERKHIAQELHDDTIQILLALSNRIQALLNQRDNQISPQFYQQLELLRDSIIKVSEDLRRLSIKLRPSILDNIGLMEALRWLVDDMNEKSIKTQLEVDGEIRKLRSETDVTLFRFVQEALNNISYHSEATSAVVKLHFYEHKIKIKIDDDGKGMVVPDPVSKFVTEQKLGLVGMQERARLLNGVFSVSSRLGKGTSISLELRA